MRFFAKCNGVYHSQSKALAGRVGVRMSTGIRDSMHRVARRLLSVKLSLLLALCLGWAAAGLAAEATAPTEPALPGELVFGIVPQQSASTLARLWAPLLARLSKDTGIRLRFATAPDIPEFERRLAAGEYDVAYMNPFHYVVFHDKVGYRALVKEADKRLKGILVVAKASPIASLDEINGLELALPAPAAFAASVLPRATLRQMGIEANYRYVGSHDSVYLAVSRGFFAVGGGVMRTLKAQAPEVQDKLRILWQTPGHTPHAFAVLPSVTDAASLKLISAFEALSGDDEGKALLSALGFGALRRAKDSDWDDIRALKLGELPQTGADAAVNSPADKPGL